MERQGSKKKFCQTYNVSFQKEELIFEESEILNCDDIYDDNMYKQVIRQENSFNLNRKINKNTDNTLNI